MIKPVKWIMLPVPEPDIESFIMSLCLRLILLPLNKKSISATVITPIPPIWINDMIISCPKNDQ